MITRRLIQGCSALALVSAALPWSSALAQEIEFGTDGLAGIVDDERTGDGEFSGGALPSFQLRGGGLVGQADGMLFDHASEDAVGGAIHAGIALGEQGFIGVYGSVSELDRAGGLTTKRIGGEVKLASGPFWLSGVAGHEDAEVQTVYVRTTATDDVYDVYGQGKSLFAFADLGWSPTPGSSLSVGFRRTGGRNAAAASASLRLTSGLSLLFQGRAGSHDYRGIFAGLRLRFGGRTDDTASRMLENRLIEDLFTASNGRRELLDPLPPPPPPEDDDGEGCGSCGGYCSA